MRPVPIIDLHCDLLSYLTHKPGRTAWDEISRCSLPQLKTGNVKLQTLAIWGNSVAEGKRQVDTFFELVTHFPEACTSFSLPIEADKPQVQFIAAFEGASGFADEGEGLGTVFKRLEEYHALLGPIFYLSLTWNHNNRFGGISGSSQGLKSDGKELLAWMHGKGIALDLSHASDRLAEECIEEIDKHNYLIPLMASHSNFRAVAESARNLPDSIAREIIGRKGLIGLNFFSVFIHRSDPSALMRHIEYGLELGGENALCFGADFFCDTDFADLLDKHQVAQAYFPEHADASCYPRVLEDVTQRLGLNEEKLLKVACRNALRFLKELVL